MSTGGREGGTLNRMKEERRQVRVGRFCDLREGTRVKRERRSCSRDGRDKRGREERTMKVDWEQ